MSSDTSTKHTPGPWRFCDSDNNPQPFTYSGPGYYNNPYIFGPNDEYIVGCDEYDVFGSLLPDDERVANIGLMIAAPDMLEALRDAATMLEDAKRYFPKSIMNRDTFRLHNVLANSVNPAIAKATGDQNA